MVLPDASLKMSEKDENGMHHVWHRYENCNRPCFSFDIEGKRYSQCELFRKIPTGVKTCGKPQKI